MLDRRVIAAATASITLFALGSTDAFRAGATSQLSQARVAAGTPPQTPYAVFGVTGEGYAVIKPLNDSTIGGFTYDDFGPSVTGTAASPSGRSALIASSNDMVASLTAITAHSQFANSVSMDAYTDEGGAGFVSLPTSVAMTEDTALVAVNEQGVVQLRRHGTRWRIDRRVKSPGVNEVGSPHQPGFIRLKAGPARYRAVAVSPLPQATGDYLGLAFDRDTKTLCTIGGVGTAHPHELGHLTNAAFVASGNRFGTSGLRFSPVTATRAVATGPSGIAVINLSNPAHPKLLGHTSITGAVPTDVAIAPDGDHVAVVAQDTISIYRGLLKTHTGSLKFVAAKQLESDNNNSDISSVAFMRDGSLAVTRLGNPSDHASVERWYLTVYDVGNGDITFLREAPLDLDAVAEDNSLSVAPGALPAAISPISSNAKVGHKSVIKVHVDHAVGHYAYGVVHGHLPKGLSIHKNKISGKPKHKGTSRVTIVALNQYGGAAFGKVTIKVK